VTSALSHAPRLARPADRGRRPNAATRLVTRTIAQDWRKTAGFAALFALMAYIQPVAYRHTYSTLAERLAFARSFAGNKALLIFYGEPHDLLTVGGYSAWRVGGTLALFAAFWGLLAATGKLRGEEESGRTEIVLSGALSRRADFSAAAAGLGAEALALWAALWLGLIAGRLPAGPSAVLALAIMSVAPVFAGVGAVLSQLTNTRRAALELSAAVFAVAFALRIVADTVSGAGWMRWLSPLGWAEEIRPFAHPRPLALLPPLAAGALLLAVAAALLRGRDIGSGLLGGRDSRAPRRALLGSVAQFTVRGESGSLAIWLGGTAVYALIVGLVAPSVSAANIPGGLRREVEKLGGGSIATPAGYVSFTFLFFVLAVSLFAGSQISAARTEEATGRLETILGLPLSRRRWLWSRLGVGLLAGLAISLLAAVLTWVGAAAAGSTIALPKMLLAALNCVTLAVLVLGVGALLYALAPRAGAALTYGLVIAAYLWQLFGTLLGAPGWLTGVTPFAHIGLVPQASFATVAALVMALVGVAGAIAAGFAIEHRDLALN
jgi:polyether ionophore transport system permease protein